MKKFILISLATLLIALVFIVAAALYLGFAKVRPTTEEINKGIAQALAPLVIIPNGINSPILSFGETIYSWEMETREGEVVGVTLKHNTGFSKVEDEIVVLLEKKENDDPSVFVKTLPALISDQVSLKNAENPKEAVIQPSGAELYYDLKLAIDPATVKTTKIMWKIKKDKLPDSLKNNYSALDSYPEPILKFLYSLPSFTLSLLGA